MQRGCDPQALRAQALFSADGGLGMHSPVVAARTRAGLEELAAIVVEADS